MLNFQPFFFPKFFLAIFGVLHFHMNFRITFSVLLKAHWGFDLDYIEGVDQFWKS